MSVDHYLLPARQRQNSTEEAQWLCLYVLSWEVGAVKRSFPLRFNPPDSARVLRAQCLRTNTRTRRSPSSMAGSLLHRVWLAQVTCSSQFLSGTKLGTSKPSFFNSTHHLLLPTVCCLTGKLRQERNNNTPGLSYWTTAVLVKAGWCEVENGWNKAWTSPVGTAVPPFLWTAKPCDFHVMSCMNATMMPKSDPSSGLDRSGTRNMKEVCSLLWQ